MDKGDTAAILNEQNVFRLFNSGVYSTDKAKFAEAEELAKGIVTSASTGDAKGLKESFAAYMKFTEKKSGYSGAGDGQGFGSEFDYKNRCVQVHACVTPLEIPTLYPLLYCCTTASQGRCNAFPPFPS